jgi:crotonobetainyl-CoA:carnitine CoA-transferase CaiB-like acyl-CoA transferase
MTGEGQYIDAAMIECASNFLGELVMANIINGDIGERIGNRSAYMAPHGCYSCKVTKDEPEWVAIAVANSKEWKALCKAMGNPDWVRKPEFSDELSRWKNQEELDRHLADWTRQFGAYEVAEKLQKAGITAAASLSTKQATHDPHLAARQFFIETEHPVLGKVLLTGLPFKFCECSRGNYERAPLLGEHNEYVFGQLLGLSKAEIQQLTEEKVFY